MTPPYATAQGIPADGITHGFFGREGGVSDGLYASLNCGLGSSDAQEAVLENRRRCIAALGAASLVTLHQVHSADAVVVTAPWTRETAPKADGMATNVPGIALGSLAADCAPILFADDAARVIGAAHAGWKGAFSGVIEATIAAMERLGAQRGWIRAAVGPCIGPASYEVGPEFVGRFRDAGEDVARWFSPSSREGHALFDLPGYVMMRLARAGVAAEDLGLDTYPDRKRFFSYRRTTHAGEPDYGRNLSAIVLL